jgi:hypothetical protein
LAALEVALSEQMLLLGASAVQAVQADLSDRLAAELEEIDRLEELEVFAGRDGFTMEQFERIEDLEEDWGDVQSALDRLTHRDYGLHLVRRQVSGRPHFFEYSTPGGNTLPKIPQDRLKRLAPVLRGRRTFSRPLAIRNPGVQVVRVGDPMVGWLESFVRSDERGRARAIQRHCPDLETPQLWFQFDVLVETGLPVDDALLVPTRTLRRLGDGYLPPQTLRLWSDGSGPPDTAVKTSLLTAVPHGSSGDISVFGERWAQLLSNFPEFAATARQAGREVATRVMSDARTRSELAQALDRLNVEFEQRERSLERVRALKGLRAEMVDEELVRLRWMHEQLATGISNPELRCIAVGAYLLTGEAHAS